MKDKGGRPTILHDQLDKLFGNIEYGRIRRAKCDSASECHISWRRFVLSFF